VTGKVASTLKVVPAAFLSSMLNLRYPQDVNEYQPKMQKENDVCFHQHAVLQLHPFSSSLSARMV
jgi:hypothetical protein